MRESEPIVKPPVGPIGSVNPVGPADPAERDRASLAQFASDVQYYLTQQPRQLPSRYFYDALGSALFEAICQLPWYGITRAETRLLSAHGHEIVLPSTARIVELGPGNGAKLAALLHAARPGPGEPSVHLVDTSPAALAVSSRALGAVGDVRVVRHESSYEAGLIEAMRHADGATRTLVLFLGSNIGNLDRPASEAFLRNVRRALATGDDLLLGADLVKPKRELLLAYDDPLGVTAAFNRNLLCRVNGELRADFDLSRFAHRAMWNEAESRIEMHLVSLERQHVRIPAAGLEFTIEAGDLIWTESSYKFEAADLIDRIERAGFSLVRQWIDQQDLVALTLARAR
jgi:dimethylhistidine N-methyltransferase